MMHRVFSIVLACAVLAPGMGLAPTSSPIGDRRGWLKGILCVATGCLGAALPSGAAVIQVERCDSGVGPGCAEEASPMITAMRKASGEKKAARDAEDLRRYNVNNFKDYFSAVYPPRKLVLHPATGKFEVLTEADLSEQMKAGTVKGGSTGSFIDNYATRAEFYFVE